MFGLISVPNSRLTKEPSKRCEIDDEVLYGTYVDILEETINYYLVRTFYDYTGYVKKEEVSIHKTSMDYFATYNGVITKPFADVLTDPTYKCCAIISLPKGAYVKILPDKLNNGFQKVQLINNQTGYIKEDSFQYRKKPEIKDNELALRKKLVENAMSYLNAQYRWGGKTIEGIDCSGLCSISYLLEDIIIYRDALFDDEIINKYGLKKITKETLKPGDLIYCKGHIMMYLGNDKYIHSSMVNNGVKINSLNPNDKDYIEKYEKNIIGYATIF